MGGRLTVICVLSHVQLFVTVDCSLLGSSACGIFQARIPEWVAIPFFRGSSWSRDQTCVSHIAGRFFTTAPTGKPLWQSHFPPICVSSGSSTVLSGRDHLPPWPCDVAFVLNHVIIYMLGLFLESVLFHCFIISVNVLLYKTWLCSSRVLGYSWPFDFYMNFRMSLLISTHTHKNPNWDYIESKN